MLLTEEDESKRSGGGANGFGTLGSKAWVGGALHDGDRRYSL